MGTVSALYQWDNISPNETVSLFIHGYATTDFAAYTIIPALDSNEPSGAVQVMAQMTNGVSSVHVDGTIAHTVIVQNQSVGPQPYISLSFLEFKQSVGG